MTVHGSAIRGRFRVVDKAVCHRYPAGAESQVGELVLPSRNQTVRAESFAQVETSVLPKSGCGLTPEGNTRTKEQGNTQKRKRPSPLPLRLSERKKKIIKAKAATAGIPVNRFIVAAALGSDYRPSADPQLTRALLALNRELSAQGNNLNQIARQLNAGTVLPGQAAMLDALSNSIQETHRRVRQALVKGREGDYA